FRARRVGRLKSESRPSLEGRRVERPFRGRTGWGLFARDSAGLALARVGHPGDELAVERRHAFAVGQDVRAAAVVGPRADRQHDRLVLGVGNALESVDRFDDELLGAMDVVRLQGVDAAGLAPECVAVARLGQAVDYPSHPSLVISAVHLYG